MRLFLKKIFTSFGFQILSIKRYEELIKSKKSYSQIGEDIIVAYIFALKGIKKPSYLDIGSNDPENINNTLLFYKKGSRGVNIDANPFCIEQFNKRRPSDINLNLGIGEQNGEAEFYIMEDAALSTFSVNELNHYLALGYGLKTKIKVPVLKINEVIQNYCDNKMPDFLSIDTEGLDFTIIRQIDFINSRPKVICVEASEHSANGLGAIRTDLLEYLLKKEYLHYGSTYLNAILVDKLWFFSE